MLYVVYFCASWWLIIRYRESLFSKFAQLKPTTKCHDGLDNESGDRGWDLWQYCPQARHGSQVRGSYARYFESTDLTLNVYYSNPHCRMNRSCLNFTARCHSEKTFESLSEIQSSTTSTCTSWLELINRIDFVPANVFVVYGEVWLHYINYLYGWLPTYFLGSLKKEL